MTDMEVGCQGLIQCTVLAHKKFTLIMV